MMMMTMMMMMMISCGMDAEILRRLDEVERKLVLIAGAINAMNRTVNRLADMIEKQVGGDDSVAADTVEDETEGGEGDTDSAGGAPGSSNLAYSYY